MIRQTAVIISVCIGLLCLIPGCGSPQPSPGDGVKKTAFRQAQTGTYIPRQLVVITDEQKPQTAAKKPARPDAGEAPEEDLVLRGGFR